MRRIKMVGLTTGIGLILVASIGAASASASLGFILGEEAPMTVEGKESPGLDGLFEQLGSQLFCEAPTFQATINYGDGTLTTENAEGQPCYNVPMDLNGCELTVSLATETFGIGPENCGPVTVLYHGISTCKLQMHPVQGLKILQLEYNNLSEAVELNITVRPKVTAVGPCGETLKEWTGSDTYSGYWEIPWVVSGPPGSEISIGEIE